MTGSDVDVCWPDPGFEVDLVVRNDLRTMTGVWRGDVRIAEALRHEEVKLRGPTELRRSFPDWLGLSLFAGGGRPSPTQGARRPPDPRPSGACRRVN